MASKRRVVVAVFGVSGVGKTTLVRSVVNDVVGPVLHLQASQLIKDAKRQDVDSESLRGAPAERILSNQDDLIAEFQRQTERSPEGPVIFDGHSVIDGDSTLVSIPVEVIRALSPTHLVFVEDAPDAIHRRRMGDRSRSRPSRTNTEIAELQEKARSVCVDYETALQIPLSILKPSDLDWLRELVLARLDT